MATEVGHSLTSTLDLRKTAMWAFLASEFMFFGAFIATFLLYRGRLNGGPGPEELFDIPFTSVSSFVLLMSSLTMVLAHHAWEENDQRQLRIWLAATALLGMTFLGGQVFEFATFVDHGLTLKTSPFGSSFFILTGFHGAHVAVGVLMLTSMIIISWRVGLDKNRGMNVELVGLYWHFVDIVWIVIFTVVYLVQV